MRNNDTMTRISVIALKVCIMVIAALSATVALLACAKTGTDTKTETPPHDIEGVAIHDVSIEYDGKAHGIKITGIAADDTVAYSANGEEWSNVELKYTDVGKYTIYVRVERDGLSKIYQGTVQITRTFLDGIILKDERHLDDGLPYEPTITGLKETDVISCKVNGEKRDKLELSGVGKYEIEIEVERLGKGYFIGSATIEIVPNISGIYIAQKMAVRLTSITAIIDGKEYAIEYDYTGVGIIDEIGEFRAVNDRLLLNGEEFVKAKPTENVFFIRIGCESLYTTATAGKAEIKFDDRAAFYIDGKEIIALDGYNYCERVEYEDGFVANIRRSFENCDVAFDFVSTSDITTVKVMLGKRAIQEYTDGCEEIYYDGHEHGITAQYSGTVYYKTNDGYTQTMPKYIDIGEYEYELVIDRDGYLPKHIKYILKIKKVQNGVYVNDFGVIEINGTSVKVNGESASLEDIEFSEECVIYADEKYYVTDKNYLLVKIDRKIYLIELDVDNDVYINDMGDGVEIENGVNRTEITDCGIVTEILIDGKKLDAIVDGCYVLGASDLGERRVVVAVVSTSSM